MDLEQHFLKLTSNKLENKILALLGGIRINNIIELGAGRGDFTRTFVKSGINIYAYEIDSKLEIMFYQNLGTPLNAGFFNQDLKDINDIKFTEDDIIISAPPYNLIEFIIENYIKPKNMRYILMVGEKHLELFEDSRVIHELSGRDFTPQSRGNHYIISNI